MASDESEKKIYPVILSGGSGTRLWPMSRALYPKQLLALNSDITLLQETALRIRDERFEPPLIVCNREHRFVVAEQLREIAVVPRAIVLEPEGRNTAPAAAVAAVMLEEVDEDAIIVLLASDHVVDNVEAFRTAVLTAKIAAENGALAALGIAPETPETGYGYIKAGAPYGGPHGDIDGCFEIAAFVEKPERAVAEGFLEAGGYFWNGSIFVFAAKTYLAELRRLQPVMADACESAVAAGERDLDFYWLDADAFTACPSRSIDYAVMEHTELAAVVPVDMDWSDIGSWSAIWEIADKDDNGNVLTGDVIAHNVTNSYIRSDSRLAAVAGLDNVIVVATDDAVLAISKDQAQSVRELVESIHAEGRNEHVTHTKVHRPWGWYQTLETGEKFQVKQIKVNPGASLSLQLHHQRAEHWVVVAGTATVTRGDETMILKENESTYIPLGVKHRLENKEAGDLRIIEIQSGAYLGEDDIVRFEDTYGRK